MSGEQQQAQKSLQVCSFLKRWMQEAQDLIPESDDDEEDMCIDYDGPLGSGNIAGKRQWVHVDVTLKKDIFLACVDDMRDELTANGGILISIFRDIFHEAAARTLQGDNAPAQRFFQMQLLRLLQGAIKEERIGYRQN